MKKLEKYWKIRRKTKSIIADKDEILRKMERK